MYKQLRFLTTMLLLAVCVGTWATDYVTVATFTSSEVITDTGYQPYSDNNWSISVGGNSGSVGFNATASNAVKINDALGTDANPNYYGSVIKSKNTIKNVSQITFTYDTMGKNSSGKIYLAYSVDGSIWNAITLTSGTQGSAISKNMVFQFQQIEDAYYGIILEKGSSTGMFRWDDVVCTFDKEMTNDPIINVEDVNIAADATSGTIPYTIVNPIEGTNLAASTTEEWISNVSVGESAITFSTSENEETTARTGIITLTYGNLTKDVSIYQNAAIAKFMVIIETPENGTLSVQKDGEEVSSNSLITVGTVLSVNPIPNEGYKFRNWQAVDASTHTFTANFTYTMGEHDVTFKANFDEIVYHTVTWSVNGKTTTETFEDGAVITFTPPTTDIPSGYEFTGWTANELEGTSSSAPAYISTAICTEDVTYFAVLAVKTPGSITSSTDMLDRATTGVSGSSYTTWSGITGESGAVYAGQSAGGNESIQLRSNSSNSGVITTTSGGKVKKVTVEWNSATASGRTLDIYGSNTAYSAATDLYNSSKQGTKLGSIVYGTSTELTVTDDYTYVGLRSHDGAMYLSSISIEWQNGTPDTYSDYCTTIPVPTITATPTTISVEAGGKTVNVTVTYEYVDQNEADVEFYTSSEATATTTCNWVHATFDANKNVELVIDANSGAARNAYMKVYSMDNETNLVYSEVITVTQAAGPSATATIAAACTDGKGKYYGTYSNTSAFILPEGVTASEISVIDGELLVQDYAAGAIVPANTGVMISSETAGEKTFYLTTGGTSVLGSENMLRPTGADGITAAEMAPADAPDCLYYRLTMHNGTTIGFWWGAPDGAAFEVAANKAYLALPAAKTGSKIQGFTFGNDGDATEIVLNALKGEQNGEMYNLQGQKVGSEYKGIVIVNGKKVMVK